MTDFSVDDIRHIESHPLNTALDDFRKSYAAKCHELGVSSSVDHVQDFLRASGTNERVIILGLIITLSLHQAAQVIPSQYGEGASLVLRLSSNQTGIEQVEPLLKVVLSKAEDIEIWTAIFDLIIQTKPTNQLTTPRPSNRGIASTCKTRSSSEIEALQPAQKRSRSNTQGDGNPLMRDRVRCRALTMRVGKPLLRASSVAAILTGVLGGLKSHESSLEKTNILHHNISIRNILLDEDESDGFLNDMDLALHTNDLQASGAPGRTGSRVFMAISALCGDRHSFMHELESFFWVLFWICAHCVGPDQELRPSLKFERWIFDRPKDVAGSKKRLVAEELAFNRITELYSTGYCKDLIPCMKELRKTVFPGGRRWKTEDRGLSSRMKAVIEKARDHLTAEKTV